MIIKKFTGKTENEAVEAARKDLGAGLVIMNVKEVKPKGLFGFLRSKTVEVTAALEEEKDVYVPVRRESTPSAEARGEKDRDKGAGAKGVLSESSRNIEQKLDSLETLLVKQLQMTEIEKEQPENAADGQTRQEESGEDEGEEKDSEQDKFIRLLYNTMLDNEVDEKYANQMLEDMDKTRRPNLPIDHLLANVYQRMILKFGKSEGITPAQNGPKAVLFIGPTGVGKTTTIAKIASNFAISEKKKVALLTADTYRIAAAEQLRTYANIMAVPFRVIYTEEELKKALEDFADYDYIFVDTAGHSPQNEDKLDKMKEMFAQALASVEYQAFLVLSATTKYKDLIKITESYQEVADYQLIFTKLDETTAYGNLLNLKLYTDRPIAFVTYGQNVPNDIEAFNPQKTVKVLLGGRR